METVYVTFMANDPTTKGKLEIPIDITARYFGKVTSQRTKDVFITVDGYKILMDDSFETEMSKRQILCFSNFTDNIEKLYKSGKALDSNVLADGLSTNQAAEEFNVFKKRRQSGKFDIPVEKINGRSYHEMDEKEYNEIVNFFNSKYDTLQEYLKANKKIEEASKNPEPPKQ